MTVSWRMDDGRRVNCDRGAKSPLAIDCMLTDCYGVFLFNGAAPLLFEGEIMTALATLRDVGFEEWLGKINTACGRFCAKTLGPGFSGAMQEFRAHALRLSVVDVSQARLYRTPREIARSDGAHFLPSSSCAAAR